MAFALALLPIPRRSLQDHSSKSLFGTAYTSTILNRTQYVNQSHFNNQTVSKTHNTNMNQDTFGLNWKMFEPQLKTSLLDLSTDSSFADVTLVSDAVQS